MGLVLSLFRKSDDGDYEKILASLDTKIRKAEMRLSDIKIRERNFFLNFILYSLLLYFSYATTYFLYLRRPGDAPRVYLLKATPVILTPLLVYMLSKLVSFWYRRRRVNEEVYLENLRTKQKMKVDELKKKTAFDRTRSLLERYDPASKKAAAATQGGAPEGQPIPGEAGMRTPQTNGRNPRDQRAMTTGRLIPMSHPRQRLTPAQRAAIGIHGPIMEHAEGIDASIVEAQQENGEAAEMMPPVVVYQAPPKSWYEKLIDGIVGEDGPSTKYALICRRCYAHNGLALPEEIDTMQYICPKCGYFNPPRRNLSPVPVTPTSEASSQVGSNPGTPTLLDLPMASKGHRRSRTTEYEGATYEAVGLPQAQVSRDAVSEYGEEGGMAEEEETEEIRQDDEETSDMSGVEHEDEVQR